MTKILHTADLHLKGGEEQRYCFSVLDEIIALALSEKVRCLVISGDLFDSFADFEALRREVCLRLKPLSDSGCEIVYIPGNHEMRGGPADLSAYNLDPVKFYARPPFALAEAGGVEFLCVPHAANYDGYRDWNIPQKKPGAARVAVLHALNSTIYTGPDAEADAKAGVIDDGFFSFFSIDYAAMGHVHAGREQALGGAVVCYPGSPRVWRAHPREAGPRSVCLIETGGSSLTPRRVEIKSAGQYREYALPLELNGAPAESAVKRLEDGIGSLDLVCVRLTGVVEDENAARASGASLCARLKARARQVYVEPEPIVAADLSSNGLTRAFLAEIDLVKPAEPQGAEYRRWLLARQYGLEALAGRIAGAQ